MLLAARSARSRAWPPHGSIKGSVTTPTVTTEANLQMIFSHRVAHTGPIHPTIRAHGSRHYGHVRITVSLRPKPAQIDLASSPMAGDPDAPVVLVVYACARCPFCTKIVPPVYREVLEGRLKGKARLYFKVFPIRGHPYPKEAGLGFVAAARMEGFWPFMLYSYENFDSFCVKKQPDWAAESGLEPQVFDQLVSAPDTRAMLVESKKEGLRNKVDATPTFFINGRKYAGTLELEELVDVLEEEHERLEGLVYREIP